MQLLIDQWNNDFGAVHDSFSTHASDVDKLLDTTKQVFIKMYDKENFFNIIRKKITNYKDDVKQPKLGDLNIQEVNESEYFFS